MKIFTNNGYWKELDRRREEAERVAYERNMRDEMFMRISKLEDRVSVLEGQKRPANTDSAICKSARRWKR